MIEKVIPATQHGCLDSVSAPQRTLEPHKTLQRGGQQAVEAFRKTTPKTCRPLAWLIDRGT